MLNILKKKMTLVAYVFSKLQTVKDMVVKQISKQLPSTVNMLKDPKHS